MNSPDTSRERRAQQYFWGLIVLLMVGYGAIKAWHVTLAFESYQDQPLTVDTTGAAN